MASTEPGNDDRWQDLMRSMDPVANLNALADIWRQAAASSERVVEDFVADGEPSPGDNGTGFGTNEATSHAYRNVDARAGFEQSIDQMADAAKQLLLRMPWTSLHDSSEGSGPTAEVAVLDGIGTTEIAVDGAEVAPGGPWATDAVRHDGTSIDATDITIRSTATYDNNGSSGGRAFIVKVMTDASPGIYFGQVLVTGEPGLMVPLRIRVFENE